MLPSTGTVFNVQRFSIHDGPGIRTTIFLKGCPLHCPWCHNPESQLGRPQLIRRESRCLMCGACARACPHCSAAGDEDLPAPTDDPRCTLCGDCVEACPTAAREILGSCYTVEELERTILSDRLFFDESGGGVTFSGGEPFAQCEFLETLLRVCRAHEIHTAVDTCGYARREDVLVIASLTDLFLYDLKVMDSRRHLELTGVPNERILENLTVLGAIHDNIWLRVPVIRGVNDSLENMEAIAQFALAVGGIRRVSLLPYHRTGVPKARRLGKISAPNGLQTPTADRLEALASCFRRCGIKTTIRS